MPDNSERAQDDASPVEGRTQRARRLRREMTKPELKLWLTLRGRRCAGLKFRRQVPMGPFFLDFFDAAHKLAVEIDGRSHDDRGEYDRARQIELERRGLTVLRISNDEVLEDVEGVVEGVVALTHRLAQGARG